MFDGENAKVELQFAPEMVSVMIDQFGVDIPIQKVDVDLYQTEVEVTVSPQFLAWVLALGNNIRISGPPAVVERMREMLSERADLYKAK